MDTSYKNRHKAAHYDRLELAVPKGMKQIIRDLAADKGMSVNAYLQDLVRRDQDGLFDTMQIAEKNREQISGIKRSPVLYRGALPVSLTEDSGSLTEDLIFRVTSVFLLCY